MALRHVASSYIECSSNIPAVSGATLCLHFTRRVDRNNWGGLIFLRNSVTGFYGGAFLYSDGDSLYYNGNSASVDSGVDVSTDVSAFVAVTYNGTGVNNGKIHAKNITDASMSSATFDVEANLSGADLIWIGDNGFGNFLDGDSLNVVVYDRVLTDAEILQQSYQRAPITRQGLNRWYPCIDPTSTSENVKDWSGNGYNATLVGSATASTGTNGITWRH